MDVLNQNLGFACRMDAPGQPYKDYQTAQMPKPKGKRGQNDGENGESNTIEIFKDYLAGSLRMPFLFPSPAAFLGLCLAGLALCLVTIAVATFLPALRISRQEPALVMREWSLTES